MVILHLYIGCNADTYKNLNLTSGCCRVEFAPSVSELWAKFKWVARIGRGEGGLIRPSLLHCKLFSCKRRKCLVGKGAKKDAKMCKQKLMKRFWTDSKTEIKQ